MADFTIKIDTDQIATIVWDCPEKPFNILNFEAIKLLDSLVDEVLLNDNIIVFIKNMNYHNLNETISSCNDSIWKMYRIFLRIFFYIFGFLEGRCLTVKNCSKVLFIYCTR